MGRWQSHSISFCSLWAHPGASATGPSPGQPPPGPTGQGCIEAGFWRSHVYSSRRIRAIASTWLVPPVCVSGSRVQAGACDASQRKLTRRMPVLAQAYGASTLMLRERERWREGERERMVGKCLLVGTVTDQPAVHPHPCALVPTLPSPPFPQMVRSGTACPRSLHCE